MVEPLFGRNFLFFWEQANILVKIVLNCFSKYWEFLDNMRAQGYDGRTSMSGIRRGVLIMIMERIPTAQCVHCKAHVLNYCTFVIRCISKYHDGYCARNLKSPSTRHLHLQLLKLHFLSYDISRPRVFTNQWWHAPIYLPFCEFDCILPLVVCSHILHVVVLIAAMLHIISYDLIEAVSECQILIRYYKTERNDISVYNTLHDEAVDLVEQFGIVSSNTNNR